MSSANRHILSDINDFIAQRKLQRRSFLQYALKTSAVSSLFAPILAGCQAQNKINIYWAHEGFNPESFAFLVTVFNSINPDINVIIHPYSKPDLLYTRLTTGTSQQFPTPDVMSLDIVWVKEFAQNGRIIPLDSYWPQLDPNWHPDTSKGKSNYLTKPLEALTFQTPGNSQKRLWGAPLHTDVGILYYRTDMPDIIDPTKANQWTWDDIVYMCQRAKANQKQAQLFAWQGGLFEGLVCNFIEFLDAKMGQILDDPINPTRVTINSQATLKTLQQMTNWVQNISPATVLTDKELDSENSWKNGDAAFMRNWPGEIAESSNLRTAVADKFNVTTLPSQSKSCLGGWQLAINSSSQNKDAAWEFIKWLLQEDAQRYLAANVAFSVTLQKIYHDSYINQQIPFYSSLQDIVENHSQLRPMVPSYPTQVTQAIQNSVHQTLANPASYPPEKALQDLEQALKQILKLP